MEINKIENQDKYIIIANREEIGQIWCMTHDSHERNKDHIMPEINKIRKHIIKLLSKQIGI